MEFQGQVSITLASDFIDKKSVVENFVIFRLSMDYVIIVLVLSKLWILLTIDRK